MNLVHNHWNKQPITGQHRAVVVSDSAKRRAAHDAQVRIAASIMAEAEAVADLVQHERHAFGFVQSLPSRAVEPDHALPRRVDVRLPPDAHISHGELDGDSGSDGDAPHEQNQGDEGSHAA